MGSCFSSQDLKDVAHGGNEILPQQTRGGGLDQSYGPRHYGPSANDVATANMLSSRAKQQHHFAVNMYAGASHQPGQPPNMSGFTYTPGLAAPNVPQNPPQNPQSPRVVRVHALYNYVAQNTDDLNFKKGDVMIVESGISEAWWLARHLETGEQGYIPSNYVTIENGLPSQMEAWYDITRKDADRMLIMPGLLQGTYILRPSSGTL